MASVSPLEYTAIGAVAGVTEVLVMMPTVSIKNALQEGRQLPRSLPAFYRGLAVRLVSFCQDKFGKRTVGQL